jgi:hypothetical protein
MRPLTVLLLAPFVGPSLQFWINFGRSVDQMVVGWLTSDMTAGSSVQYGTSSGSYPNSAEGNATFYKYSAAYTSGLIHHVTLSGLAPNTKYFYRVGSDNSWSQEFTFTSNPGLGQVYPYTIGFVADVGESAAANGTLTHLLSRLDSIDSMVIAGDIAYASGCEATGCITWDAFQRMYAPVAAYKPFHVNLGNHELLDVAQGTIGVSARTRFSGMPYPVGSSDDIFYFSYEVGPVHVISVCSFYLHGFSASSPLVQWVTQDLKKVNRHATPWVIVALHAPWYNSNSAHQGDGEPMRVGLESLFVNMSVAAIMTGHVHSYERTNPVVNSKVVPAGQGIVHFNIGDGGASLYTTWLNPQPAWSAYRDATWGHGEFVFVNNTHAQWTWHRNQDNEPIVQDEYYVVNPYQG